MSDKKVISAKISGDDYSALEMLGNKHNMSISAIIKLCIDGLRGGDIEIEKGELRIAVDPSSSAVCEEDFNENLKYKELRFDRLLSAFERQGYPESVIRQSIEQMIIQVNDTKYSSKRARFEDGC